MDESIEAAMTERASVLQTLDFLLDKATGRAFDLLAPSLLILIALIAIGSMVALLAFAMLEAVDFAAWCCQPALAFVGKALVFYVVAVLPVYAALWVFRRAVRAWKWWNLMRKSALRRPPSETTT